jgi:hypothetical protein
LEQYYGFSKVVDPWKNHNIVREYRCSGGDLHGMMGNWFTIMTMTQLQVAICDANSKMHERDCDFFQSANHNIAREF